MHGLGPTMVWEIILKQWWDPLVLTIFNKGLLEQGDSLFIKNEEEKEEYIIWYSFATKFCLSHEKGWWGWVIISSWEEDLSSLPSKYASPPPSTSTRVNPTESIWIGPWVSPYKFKWLKRLGYK